MPLLKRIKLRLTEDSFHESVNMIWVLVGQDPSDSGNMAYVGTNTERVWKGNDVRFRHFGGKQNGGARLIYCINL